MKRLVLGLIAVLAAAPSAWAIDVNPMKAAPGYTYFNKVGATLADHQRDVKECFSVAIRLRPPEGPMVAMIRGDYLIFAQLNFAQDNNFLRGNVERCMLVRRWRVVRLDPAVGAPLAKQPGATVAAQLATWVGASAPTGQVIRTFGEGELAQNVASPVDGSRSLSIAALEGERLNPDPDFRQAMTTGASNRSQLKSLAPAAVADVPAGKALVVVRLTGRREDNDRVFSFTRLAESARAFTGERPPESAPWFMTPIPRTAFKSGQGKSSVDVVFAVEPGWWAVTSQGFVATCLMTPTVQIAAGEVVYFGDFDLDDPLRPKLDPAPARAALGGQPGLAGKVRPAVWTNGASWTCRELLIGGFEVVGAPYVDGFRFPRP